MAVDLISIILFLLIGLSAGWLADVLVKGVGFGLLGDMIVGIVGALIGGLVFGLLNISIGGSFVGPLIAAFIGAVILLLIIKMVRRA